MNSQRNSTPRSMVMISILALLPSQHHQSRLKSKLLPTTALETKKIPWVIFTNSCPISQKATSSRVSTMTRKSSGSLAALTRAFQKTLTVASSSLSTWLMIRFQSTSQPRRTQASFQVRSSSVTGTRTSTMTMPGSLQATWLLVAT